MRRIIIVGYMGAGKTTVGKALAKDTGLQFYDLDWYIEGRMRKTANLRRTRRGRLQADRTQPAARGGGVRGRDT